MKRLIRMIISFFERRKEKRWVHWANQIGEDYFNASREERERENMEGHLTIQDTFELLDIPYKSMHEKWLDGEPLGWSDKDGEKFELPKVDCDGDTVVIHFNVDNI